MFDKFTDRARKIIAHSQKEAERLGHDHIGAEHLMLGMVKEGSGVAVTALGNLRIDLDKVRQEIEKMLVIAPKKSYHGRSPLPFTPQARRVLEVASEEARALGHPYIGSEHVLLGLISDRIGIPAKALINLQLELNSVRNEIIGLLGTSDIPNKDGDLINRITNRYIFIIRSGKKALTPGDYKLRFEELNRWSSLMKQEGRNLYAGVLGNEAFLVTHDSDNTPSPQTEVLSAWFIFIDAADFSEAEKLAKEHPDLRYGYSIEVRKWCTSPFLAPNSQ